MSGWFEQFGGKSSGNTPDWFAQFGGNATEALPEKKKPMGLWENVKESGKEALRHTAQIPRNIIAGMGDIADLPIAAVDYGLKKSGLKSEDSSTFYPGQTAANLIDTATMGYTKPESPRERAFEAGTRAIASIPAGAGLGNVLQGVKGVAKLGRGLQKINPTDPTSLVGVGAGALAGHEYNETNPEDLVGTLGTSMAADMATRTALGLANKKNLQRSVANAFKINPKNVETFHNAGMTPTLGQASDHPGIKLSENAIKNLSPTMGLRKAIGKQYEQMSDTLGPGALGHAVTEQEAGTAIKSALKAHGIKASDIVEKIKNRYLQKAAKAPTDAIDVTDALAYFEKLDKKAKTTKAKKRLYNSPVGKEYKELAEMAAENRGAIPIEDLIEFRTDLNDVINSKELGKNPRRKLTGLEKQISADIEDYMKGIGALKDWNQYNKFYAPWATKRKPHVLEASDTVTPAHEAHKLFESIGHTKSLDRSLLDSVYASQKKSAQNETLDSLIQKLGNNGGNFDLHLLQKRLANQPPETLELLLSPRPKAQREKIKAIMEAVDINKDLASYGNPSRTAYMHAALKGIPLGALGIYHLGKGEGIDKPEIAALTSLVALMVGSKAFSSPRVVNWMYRGTKIKTPEGMKHHIAGIKGILGRPFYQQLRNSINLLNNE